MKLSIDALKDTGSFCGAPVEKEITWTTTSAEYDDNDEKIPGTEEEETFTATVYVRPLSYAAAVSDVTSKDAVAGRIAVSILGEDGKPIFTPEDVTGEADPERGPLCRSLTIELLRVIGEVSGGKKKKA